MGIEWKMGELVEAGEWERVRKLLESTVVEVDAYEGLLLRQAVERTDLEGVRMLLQEWKAEVGFLRPISPPPTGEQFREVIALLLEAAEANPKLGREELLHRLMQMAIHHDALELGKHLLDDCGVDVNAHCGMYVRMALARSDDLQKSLALEFFSRDLSKPSLQRLPWEALFSSTGHWMHHYEELVLAMAEKIDYPDHARGIATALEVRDWLVVPQAAARIRSHREVGEEHLIDEICDRLASDNRALHEFCRFWERWDRQHAPKEKLRAAWRERTPVPSKDEER